jgi:hypothetical protein
MGQALTSRYCVIDTDLHVPCHLGIAHPEVPDRISSRVRDSVTNNNNGFWIGWLDLLTPSCTISLNYIRLQN